MQWLVTLAALAGLGWLVVGYAVRVLGLPPLDTRRSARCRCPRCCCSAGLLAGVLIALLARPVVGVGGPTGPAPGRATPTQLRGRSVGEKYVVDPVRAVLRRDGARRRERAAGPPAAAEPGAADLARGAA